jgi:hypothetical protein
MRQACFLRATIALASAALPSTALPSMGLAQQQPTTVQLPTFRVFTVQTTVSVPDSGGGLLGGVTRGRDGKLTRGIGPFKNRSLGSERGTGTMSARATIIDHRAIDEAILAAARRDGTPVDAATIKAGYLSRHVGTSIPTASITPPSSSPASSVAALRDRNTAVAAAQAVARESEAAELLAKAARAEADGKSGLATIYYQMVLRRDAGQLKQQALARLAAITK